MDIFDQIILNENMMIAENETVQKTKEMLGNAWDAGKKVVRNVANAKIIPTGYEPGSSVVEPDYETDPSGGTTHTVTTKGRITTTNLSQIGSWIARMAARNPKILIVAGNAILLVITATVMYNQGYNKGFNDGKTVNADDAKMKLLIGIGLGALSAGLLALGYKLVKHFLTKSAAEVAASNKPKEQKLKTLNGLLSTAQKAVAKAKNPDDKQLAQASVDIIQRHINTVQSQG